MKSFRFIDLISLVLCLLSTLCIGIGLLAETDQRSSTALCQDRMRSIAVACANYHDTFNLLPMGADAKQRAVSGYPRSIQISGFASLLPALNEQKVYDEFRTAFATQNDLSTTKSGAGVPSLLDRNLAIFKCPADPKAAQVAGSRSYVFSFGDALQVADPNLSLTERKKASRGMFAIGLQFKFDDVSDGLAGTILFSETAVGTAERETMERVQKQVDGLLYSRSPLVMSLDPSQPSRYTEKAELWEEGKGTSWLDGTFRISGFSTTIWPNMPSATGQKMTTAIMSASSHHRRGVMVCFADGAVRFVSAAIESGGFNAASLSIEELGENVKSPYGLWGSAAARSDGVAFLDE